MGQVSVQRLVKFLRVVAHSSVSTLQRSPLALVGVIGALFLCLLVVRGLNFGALQTDIIIIRAWFDEVGVGGFTQRYFDVNQRHLLVGPLVSAAYTLFGKQDAPYNFILLASRIVQGIFLTGLVFQVTQRRWLAVCAGLALMFSVIRVPELYQQINWFIEPSLVLLLASSYAYALALRASSKVGFRLWYLLSIGLYAVSVLLYEAGLPWLAVNIIIGWILRPDASLRRRLLLVIRDALPTILCGLSVGGLLLFVFKPWTTLAPSSSGVLERFLAQLISALNFPALYSHVFAIMANDRYVPLFIAAIIIPGSIVLATRTRLVGGRESRTLYSDTLALALTMLVASILVGISSGGIVQSYEDRITFGRIAGVTLIYVTGIFAICDLLLAHPRLALFAVNLLLIAPGFTWLWMYQDYAHATAEETEHLTDVVLQNRPNYGASPLFLVIITPPDWAPAHFVDASDVILHNAQQNLWTRGGDVVIDILHMGANPDEYATLPGACDTFSREASAGLCLLPDAVHTSRWGSGPTHPLSEIVVARYDDQTGQLTMIPSISLNELAGYNITTSGPTELKSRGN